MDDLKQEEIVAEPVEEIDSSLAATADEELTVAALRPALPPELPLPSSRSYLVYIGLPALFLLTALMGGLRLSGLDGSFIFVRPPLIALVFALVLLVLFVRNGLIRMDGWFDENAPVLTNIANAVVLATLFFASVQLFNSLLPEQGLPFWVVSFCFFWVLWTNLFADFGPAKLLRSLGGLFAIAFLAKYMLLAGLTAPDSGSWLRSLIENPGREAATWLLDLPRFSPGTGYIQFFTAFVYLLGLYLIPPAIIEARDQ
jgi:hypothetical protein